MSLSSDPTHVQLLGLEPEFRRAMIIKLNWERQWLPVIVSEGRRTRSRQLELFAQGRLTPGPIVTYTATSAHTRGLAADIDIMGYPPDQVPNWVWEWAGTVGEAVGLRWGGRFERLRDLRHFEATRI